MNYINFILLFCLFACGSKNTNSIGNKVEMSNSLYEIIHQNEYSGYGIKENKIIETEELFNKLINDLKLDNVQKIDFSLYKVVVLNLGEKTTGGYSISTNNVKEEGNVIVVDVYESSPKANDFVTDALTYPICILKIKSRKEIVFKTKTSSK
jgi:hypothetical protein